MSLLDQDVKKEKTNSKKKMVLYLLIFLIFVLILAIVMLLSMSENSQVSIVANGTSITQDDYLLYTDENTDVTYISLQKIASALDYDYYTGKYKEYSEDSTNTFCYLESDNHIVEFEADSNLIYKTTEDSQLDYEEYELNYNISKSNDLLYISLSDLSVGLNVIYSYSQSENKITLSTVETLTESYTTTFSSDAYTGTITSISDEYYNEKALSYNMLVVSNENKKWGVVDGNYSQIIGNKYTTMEFVEQAQTFIVSDNEKYGVITAQANTTPIVALNYDSVSVVNYNPLCYLVELAGKFVIVDENGNPIVSNSFDGIGYTSSNSTEEAVVAIDDVNSTEQTALVVCKDNKYGLISLDNGSVIMDCLVDKIYAKNTGSEKSYYVEVNENEFRLERYIEYLNTTTVNISNNN